MPCTFELDIPNLGYLDNNPGHVLKSSTKLELPFWLSEPIALYAQEANVPLIDIDFPDCLKSRVLNALKADPKTVDLRAQAQHYYALGARLLNVFEDNEVLEILMETYRQRAQAVADHASNAGGRRVGEGVEFLRGLDELERSLFRKSHDGSKAMRVWMGEMKKK